MSTFGSSEHRERLKPILDQLEAAGESVFLDLCELVMMVSEHVKGSIKFEHERVTVSIKRQRKKRIAEDGKT